MPRVRVEAPVHPTESLAKVKLACLNAFPDLAFVEEGETLVGETANLDRLRELVRNEKIRDTMRDALIQGIRGRSTHVLLSKQAAFVGRMNLATRSPLGDIRVTIEDDDLESVIDYVAESTASPRFKSRSRSGGT